MRPLLALSVVVLVACPSPGGPDGGDDGGQRCVTTEECGTAGPCELVNCTFGRCRRTLAPAGASAGAQTPGDCKRLVCDANGNVSSENDDTDVRNDGNACTVDTCSAGSPVATPTDAGTPCGTGGAMQCNAAGQCVGCSMSSDCFAATECRTPTCVNNVCGSMNQPQGTRLTAQDAGDCRAVQCNGMGGTESVADDTDLPNDGRTCTRDLCTNGVPSHPPAQSGTPCADDGGTLCDSSGACRQCLVASDCPGADTECRARTCVNGVCGAAFADAGIAVTSQTAGDCRRSVCDGAGGVTAANDDADLPNDNNACTANACDGGAAWYPPLDAGISCGTSSVCNAVGQCVGCNVPQHCGASDACKTRTCTNGTCGLNLAPAGTVVSNPAAGDCQRNVCDSQGNIVSAAFDTDVPADDGNPCTSEVCTNGVPSHPTLPTNTACDAGVCNASGQCVQCNVAGQCAGADSDCRARTCVNGLCGVFLFDAGTVAGTQTAGDCRQNRCDGDGGVVSAVFDSDLPLDDGQQCTAEVCDGGAPSRPPRPLNTACTSGGLYCDGSGACVECNVNGQCASMICAAATHTCAAPTCTDMVKNGAETDTDCGGGTCPVCGPGLACVANGDCSGGACHPTTRVCAPTCNDTQSPGSTCTSYCTCMMATCSGKFASMAACISACASFNEPQLCCRAYHCTAAMSSAAVHCPHAAGEAVCP